MTLLVVDPTPVVKPRSDGSVSSHGELFYATFKSSIIEFLVTAAAEAVEHLTADVKLIQGRQHVVAGVMTAMLDHVAHDTQQRGRTYVITMVFVWIYHDMFHNIV